MVHGLACTSLARGHNVTVIMPFYECLPQDQIDNLGFEMEIDVPKGYTWDGVMQVGGLKCAYLGAGSLKGGGEEVASQDQIDNLGFETEIDVPKGYTWDGVMQV